MSPVFLNERTLRLRDCVGNSPRGRANRRGKGRIGIVVRMGNQRCLPDRVNSSVSEMRETQADSESERPTAIDAVEERLVGEHFTARTLHSAFDGSVAG